MKKVLPDGVERPLLTGLMGVVAALWGGFGGADPEEEDNKIFLREEN